MGHKTQLVVDPNNKKIHENETIFEGVAQACKTPR